MGAYHQLGHDSASIVLEPELNEFMGVLLSPVNTNFNKAQTQCDSFRKYNGELDIIFDPQLYMPKTNRGQLQSWPYIPDDIDTHDQSSEKWWLEIITSIIQSTKPFQPNGICSPAPFPRNEQFEDAYYELLVLLGNDLKGKLQNTPTRPVLTALVGLNDLSRNNRHFQVSSILSKYKGDEIFVVFSDNEIPRRERSDSATLEGAARLIRLLTKAGFKLIIGCTSSEMILWKAAGAQHVASGKFFNLRRFSLSRWDDDASQGGRNISYWFEPSLLAFLREADLRRYIKDFNVDSSHDTNPYSRRILDKLKNPVGEAWLADSWRQFLYWFAHTEGLIGTDASKISGMLNTVSVNWKKLHENKLMLEEERNDGSWIHPWYVVLNELSRRPD